MQGIDVNFGSSTLSPTDVLRDNQVPQPTDISSEFTVDQSFLGLLVNDHAMTTPTRRGTVRVNLHGAGAVYKEYARLVRQDVLAAAGIPDGDVTQCVLSNTNLGTGNPATYYQSLPPYCTGFEGFVTAAPNTGAADYTNLGLAAVKIGASRTDSG